MHCITIQITDAERAEIIKGVRSDLVRALLDEHGDELRLLSIQQVCGLLDADRKTVEGYGIPKAPTGGRSIKYRVADVAAFLSGDPKKKGAA